MLPGNERQGFIQILAQFLKRARLSGVAAGRLNAAAAKLSASLLKSANVVALPAVQGNWYRFEPLQGGFGIDAHCGVALPCQEIFFVVHRVIQL